MIQEKKGNMVLLGKEKLTIFMGLGVVQTIDVVQKHLAVDAIGSNKLIQMIGIRNGLKTVWLTTADSK